MFIYEDTLNALQYAPVNSLSYLELLLIHPRDQTRGRAFAHRLTAPILIGISWTTADEQDKICVKVNVSEISD